jgi:hypothetical protein
MLFSQNPRPWPAFYLFCLQNTAMTRFDVILDVYETSDRFTIFNLFDRSAIKKFPQKSRDFGFSWMPQSQTLSGTEGAKL